MKVQLPGGRIVELAPKKKKLTPRAGDTKDLLSGGARAFFERDLGLDLGKTSLAEFHALRAIAAHEGWLEEAPVEIACRNCERALDVKPCASMPIGPFRDAELDDDELDELLDTNAPHEVRALGKKIRFRPITVNDAAALHRALAKEPLDVTAEVVTAMGVAALGETTDPRKI